MNAVTHRAIWRAVAAVGLLAATAEVARAQTFDWNNPSGGNFSTPANWSPLGPPGAGGTARFPLANTYNVTFTGPTTVNALTVNLGEITFFLNGWTLTTLDTVTNGMGATNATSSLRITNGTFQPGDFSVGGNSGSNSTLTLDGLSNTTVGAGVFFVGTNGTGTVKVQGGATLNTSGSTGLGILTSGVGTGIVTGAGSSWTVANTLRVGINGSGTLNVLNGGVVTANALEVGENFNSVGTLFLSGAGATLTTSGTANIGGASAASPAASATVGVGAGATLNLNGTTNLRTTGTINLTGGTLNLNTFNFAPGAVVNFTSGTVNFANASSLTAEMLNLLLAGTNTLGTNRTLSAAAGTLNLTTPLALSGGKLNVADLLVNANMNIGAFGSVNASNTVSIETGKTVQIEDFAALGATSYIQNNGGVLDLKGPLATVTGFLTNNFGVVQGTGRFAAGLNNGIGGTIRAREGDHLVIQQLGMTNPGRIELSGGVVEYTNVLSNLANGIISGRGEFRGGTANPGGNGLSNIGLVQLSGGTTDVRGDVNNAGAGKIIISGGSVTTFFDDLTHNGAEFRVSTGSTAVFFGNVTGAGPFTGSGTKIFEAGSPVPDTLASIVGDTIVASNVTLTTGVIREDDLKVYGQAKIAPNGSNAATSRVNTLSIEGRFDLSDNKLIVAGQPIGTYDGSAYTGVIGLIDSGRGNNFHALWDGNGIVTSDTRAVNNANFCSLGVATAGELNRTTFGGLSVASDDVLVMLTYGGDANLDGKINIDDYGRIDGNVGQSNSVFGWFNGDFNYDGRINIDDYGIIDGNINSQGAPFATAGVSAVPEPVGVAVVALVALASRRRRRRRSPAATRHPSTRLH